MFHPSFAYFVILPENMENQNLLLVAIVSLLHMSTQNYWRKKIIKLESLTHWLAKYMQLNNSWKTIIKCKCFTDHTLSHTKHHIHTHTRWKSTIMRRKMPHKHSTRQSHRYKLDTPHTNSWKYDFWFLLLYISSIDKTKQKKNERKIKSKPKTNQIEQKSESHTVDS